MEVQPTDDLLDGGWFTTEELAGMLGVDPSTLPLADRPAPAGPAVRVPVLASDLYSAQDVRRWLATRRIDPGQAA
jgi:hypothetical protein